MSKYLSNESEIVAEKLSEQSVVHTPGPWEVLGPSQNSRCRRVFAGDEYIGTVGGSDQSIDTIIANANLFAAAPDLLEELQRMIQGAEFFGWPATELSDAKKAVARALGI